MMLNRKNLVLLLIILLGIFPLVGYMHSTSRNIYQSVERNAKIIDHTQVKADEDSNQIKRLVSNFNFAIATAYKGEATIIDGDTIDHITNQISNLEAELDARLNYLLFSNIPSSENTYLQAIYDHFWPSKYNKGTLTLTFNDISISEDVAKVIIHFQLLTPNSKNDIEYQEGYILKKE